MSDTLMNAGSVAAVLLIIGGMLKTYLPKGLVRYIPPVLLVIGTGLFVGLSGKHDLVTVVAGIEAAAAAIGIHSGTKNTLGIGGSSNGIGVVSGISESVSENETATKGK